MAEWGQREELDLIKVQWPGQERPRLTASSTGPAPLKGSHVTDRYQRTQQSLLAEIPPDNNRAKGGLV